MLPKPCAAIVASFLSLAVIAPSAVAQYLPIRDLDSNDLLSIDGASNVRRGRACGTGGTPTVRKAAARWDSAGSHLLPPLAGHDSIGAYDLDENDAVVGTSWNLSGSQEAVLWTGDVPVALSSLATDLGSFTALWTATGIDRRGRICGYGDDGSFRSHGFLLEGGTVLDLAPSSTTTIAWGMNDRRMIVGGSDGHAFLWDDGTFHDLHDPAQITGSGSGASDVDRFGRACGGAEFTSSGGTHYSAVLFDHGTIVDLGASNALDSAALGINDFGVIVGWRHDSPTSQKAVLFDGTTNVDLDTLIDPALGWELRVATAIDNEGRIVGSGSFNGKTRAFILEPPCAGWFAAYGSGCAGSAGREPVLRGAGCPAPDADFAVELLDGLENAPSFLFVGSGQGTLQVKPGCDLQVLPLVAVFPVALDGFGEFWCPTRLPPGTPPFDLFAQVLVLDTGAPHGIAASAPLQIHFE